MTIRITDQKLIFTEGRIQTAILDYLSLHSVAFEALKKLRFHWHPPQQEPVLVVGKVCRTFQIEHKLYSFEEVKEQFEDVPPTLSLFKKSLGQLSEIEISDGWEEKLCEKMEKRLLENPKKTTFRFHVTDQPEPSVLIAKIKETTSPLFQLQASVYSHERALRVYQGCPLDKEAFIAKITQYPQLIVPEKSASLEEILSEEPSQNMSSYEHRGVLYLFSKKLQESLLGLRGKDHFVPIQTLLSCLRKKHNKLVAAATKEPNKQQYFDYHFNYGDILLNLEIAYFPSSDDPDKPLTFVVVRTYIPTHGALRRGWYNLTEAKQDYLKEKLPTVEQ